MEKQKAKTGPKKKVGKKQRRKRKTDTFYCRSISDTHFAGSILCNE